MTAALVVMCMAASLTSCSVPGEAERASLEDHPAPDAGPMVGAPLTEVERRNAYALVLRDLPDRLRRFYPALQPGICLDRGIRTGPGGAYVDDHADEWVDDALDDGLVQAVGDRSTAGCPEQSFWVTLLLTRLLPGDSVAVPLTAQPVLRGPGGQVDPREWTAVLTGRGSAWVVAAWR